MTEKLKKTFLSHLDTLDCIFNLQLRFAKLRFLLSTTICGEKRNIFNVGQKCGTGLAAVLEFSHECIYSK